MSVIDFNSLDSMVHGPIRLGILTALQMDNALDFTTIKKRLKVSDGSLGLHLQKLKDIKYITCKKSFVGRRPKSVYQLTPAGRKALSEYLNSMSLLINSLENK
ncbi:transcriptional regulator [Planctomycetota bacterium]